MKRGKQIIDAPKRMLELWGWVEALDAWDYCSPGLLAKLIRTEPIPDELKRAVSDIIEGVRIPNKKGAAKLKLDPELRMFYARTASSLQAQKEAGLKEFTQDGTERKGLDAFAEARGIEPFEALKILENQKKNLLRIQAGINDISVETMEKLMRTLSEKIENWPDV